MDTQELMKPRYILLAPWPGCNFKVGDIFIRHHNIPDWCYVPDGETAYAMNGLKESAITNSPANLRPLQWWEHRDEKDMPEYVKDSSGIVGKRGEIMNNNLKDCVIVTYPGGGCCSHISNWMPSTHAEYLSQSTK